MQFVTRVYTRAQMLKWCVYKYVVRDCMPMQFVTRVYTRAQMLRWWVQEAIPLGVVRYSYTHVVRDHVSMQFAIRMSIQFVSGM